MSFARISAIGVSAALTVALASLVAPAAPPTSRELTAAVSSESESSLIRADELAPAAAASPEVAEAVALPAPSTPTGDSSASPAAQPGLPTTGAASWAIDVDTRGYQDEIDDCLWVRMDLGGQAPIVGAHNYCGGGVVLDMSLGDTVTLTGTDLDGKYVVTDDRDARAGDTAATAIAGMVGRVILQTCYWSDDGSVRLVGLTPAPST